MYQFIYFFIEIDEISYIREISLMGSFYTLFFKVENVEETTKADVKW